MMCFIGLVLAFVAGWAAPLIVNWLYHRWLDAREEAFWDDWRKGR